MEGQRLQQRQPTVRGAAQPLAARHRTAVATVRRRCALLCRWAALGGFNVSVDLTVAAALTSTAIEPYAIETGADIPPYDDRAAYTTAGSTVFSGPTRQYAGGGNRNVDVVVRRADTGAVVASRTVALVIEQTEPATRTCERDEDDNGGSSTTCTDSCSRGNLIGEPRCGCAAACCPLGAPHRVTSARHRLPPVVPTASCPIPAVAAPPTLLCASLAPCRQHVLHVRVRGAHGGRYLLRPAP